MGSLWANIVSNNVLAAKNLTKAESTGELESTDSSTCYLTVGETTRVVLDAISDSLGFSSSITEHLWGIVHLAHPEFSALAEKFLYRESVGGEGEREREGERSK
jgi:hypothetical protein